MGNMVQKHEQKWLIGNTTIIVLRSWAHIYIHVTVSSHFSKRTSKLSSTTLSAVHKRYTKSLVARHSISYLYEKATRRSRMKSVL